MATYVRLVLNGLFIVASLALVGPFLISAKDDLLFVAGILYLTLVLPAILFYANRNYINGLVNKLNGDSN